MKQVLIWLVVAVLLAGAGIGLSMVLTASKESTTEAVDPATQRRMLIETARRHGREAWAEKYPNYPDARCLHQMPLFRPDPEAERIYLRFSWSENRGGVARQERVEMYLDPEGRLLGPVTCTLERRSRPVDTGPYL